MKEYNIADFGGVGDGKTLNTKAFESAFSAASEAGGGRIIVPKGTWLTGPIQFKSHITLHLELGALIQFSKNFDDYPLVKSDYEGQPEIRCISPLWAEGVDNIAITGEGIIDGAGEAWRPVKKFKMTDDQWNALLQSGGVMGDNDLWWPSQAAASGHKTLQKLRTEGKLNTIDDYKPVRDYLRPTLMKFTNCKNVLLEGCTFRNSPAWNLHLLVCENLTCRNIRVENPWWSSNGDGIDIDSCRNVTVVDSFFDCGDDAICIKSGKDEAGRKRGKPCENVLIDNCVVLHGHGGVTIGSEMSGGVRNVRVVNCIFKGTDIGLRFKSTRGRGGVVENIEMSNVVMHDIKTDAISLNLYYWISGQPVSEPVSERTPIFRGISFRNITCDGARRAIEVRGLPEMPIQNVTFDNIRITAKQGIVVSDATGVRFNDVNITTTEAPAMRIHNVKNLSISNAEGTGPTEGLGNERVGDL